MFLVGFAAAALLATVGYAKFREMLNFEMQKLHGVEVHLRMQCPADARSCEAAEQLHAVRQRVFD